MVTKSIKLAKRVTKTKKKLAKKRDLICRTLNIPYDLEDKEVIKLAYEHFKKPLPSGGGSFASYHAKMDAIKRWIRQDDKKPKNLHKKSYFEDARKFYNSYAWRKLRLIIIEKYGRRCLCCGATPDDGVQIHVDHIKPLKKYWHLRLDPDNLQVLCEVCNHGKGNWNETDWRDK